ncbi:putative methionine permease [Talaromyces proteolyticus]|uniref:Methionine permease n=1 Tax=Talaromyces proteolyticus TaxID=1131652 RepID=A0AAD4KFV9_9EURO|nr:putative methionine permease [Talaromyces proteolyticus]KAH8691378.1 putative methionine permease [Talaromyces proteolyticus]
MPDIESSETSPLLSPSSTIVSSDTISPDHPDRSIEHDILPETATYGRNLSWSSAYILVISRVIGSGIFATPGAIVKSVGSVGLALSLWVAGTILSACGMAVSLEYGCMLPRSGGDKVYLEFTYRYPKFLASTLIAVQAVLLGFTASNCIIFSKYTSFALNIEPTEFQSKVLAVGLLTVITIIHGRFMKAGIAIQNALGWVKIFLIVFMALSGVYVILFHERSEVAPTVLARFGSQDIDFWDELWKDSDWSWNTLSTSLFKVFYSYAGLSNMNNVLNEVKNPVRTLKTVCPAALITACLLYLLANVSYFLVVPIEEIKQSGELVAALFFERAFGPHLGRTILPLMIAVSAVGNVMVVTFALARVNQEVARQGFLPFARTISSSKPFNSPLWGLVVHYVPSFLVITIPPQGGIYNFILDVEGYPGQFFALAITAGLILLRYRRPDLKRPFKAWLPAVWLRVVTCLALLAAPFFPPVDWKGDVDFFYATYAIVGIGIILFGVLYWYIWTVLLPKWGGYTLEEEVEVLDDGTSITKLVHSHKL